ncbi:MAG: hypothetical protein PHP42_09625, partial [Bacteroidota bacterium]|nr:hypothetical protein [Bacteroidota bacterium]
MKKIFFLLHIALISFALAQVESRKPAAAVDIPEFYMDALSFASSDSLTSRVDLYAHVPYDALQFVKSDNQYVAKYEVTFNFLTDDNASVSEKAWSEEVRVQQFDQTLSKHAYSLTERSVAISPGIYTLRAQMRDNESKKISTVVKKIIVGNYSTSNLALSDILLVTKVTTEGEKRNLVPNIPGNVGENNNVFYLFFELYSPQKPDSLEL